MFLTHEFYENSASGANSYVNIFATREEALEEMYYSVLTHISNLEEVEAETIVDLLKGKQGESDEEVVEIESWFTIEFCQDWYNINSEWDEDIYRFRIENIEVGLHSEL